MQYKIFAPGAQTLTDQPLKDAGLEDLCRDSGASWERTILPDGTPGAVGTWVLGNPQLDAPPGVPEAYEWTKIPGTELLLGHDPLRPPGPVELARKVQMASAPLELGDGRTWQIPVARGLPHTIVPGENGSLVADVDDRFRVYSQRTFRHATALAEREEEIGKLAGVFFGVRLTDDELTELYVKNRSEFAGLQTLDEMDQKLAVSILFDEALDHAVDALAINYRLNRFMVGHFRLLKVSPTVNHLRDICLVAMEAREIMEHLKKNDLERRISLLAG